jgi:hypothetical protein
LKLPIRLEMPLNTAGVSISLSVRLDQASIVAVAPTSLEFVSQISRDGGEAQTPFPELRSSSYTLIIKVSFLFIISDIFRIRLL